jgi:hypothetical protein
MKLTKSDESRRKTYLKTEPKQLGTLHERMRYAMTLLKNELDPVSPELWTALLDQATAAGILLKPISVVSREAAWDNVIEVMENVHAKQPHSDRTPEEQEADIVEIVKASRRKHAKRRS